ncbi:hypothetical protein JB92DRAFT_3106404 [Gautieria morchelliformis]|nr:hypothetical protein JB92DRAFT_3106404 [Gautieria morchelliformis]
MPQQARVRRQRERNRVTANRRCLSSPFRSVGITHPASGTGSHKTTPAPGPHASTTPPDAQAHNVHPLSGTTPDKTRPPTPGGHAVSSETQSEIVQTSAAAGSGTGTPPEKEHAHHERKHPQTENNAHLPKKKYLPAARHRISIREKERPKNAQRQTEADNQTLTVTASSKQ